MSGYLDVADCLRDRNLCILAEDAHVVSSAGMSFFVRRDINNTLDAVAETTLAQELGASLSWLEGAPAGR